MPFPMKADGKTPDWDAAFFDSPEQAIAANNAGLAKQIKDDLVREWKTEEFWKLFFGSHPDLRRDESIVKASLAAVFEETKTLAVDDAIERIADHARAAIAVDQRERAMQREYGVMRGGPGMAPGQVNMPPPGQGQVSLGDRIRQKAENRRIAQQGGPRDSYGNPTGSAD